MKNQDYLVNILNPEKSKNSLETNQLVTVDNQQEDKKMGNIYTSGDYLQATQTWHVEDSPWKANQIATIISNNNIHPSEIVEIGCGAGAILKELSEQELFINVKFRGYDISPQAIGLSKQIENKRVNFSCEDILSATNQEHFDVLLAIDVFEHIPDYMGFLSKCRDKAEYKIFHVPLDLHVSSVFRNVFISNRYTIGHLHYFTADSAIASLKDTGHEIVDYFYTNAAFDTFQQHPSFRKAMANIPRWVFSKFSVPFAARLLGGYSLLVLTK